jgi:hypothetical protein
MGLLHELSNPNIAGYLINEQLNLAVPKILSKNNMFIEFGATLQDADKPNRNGRRYLKKILKEGISTDYIMERLRTKTLYGEAGKWIAIHTSNSMSKLS